MLPDFRLLFESVPGKYLVLSPGLEVIAASNAFLAAVGAVRKEITGKNILDVWRGLNVLQNTAIDLLATSLAKVMEDKTEDAVSNQQAEIQAVGEEGLHHCWTLVHTPILNEKNEVLYVIQRVDDVSAAMRLKELVARKDVEVNMANTELDSFSYSVSHDLRAPLHIISGYAQILEEDYKDKIDEDGRQNLQHIRKLTLQMGELIANLFSYSRASRKELVRTQVNMQDVAEEVVSTLKQQNKKSAPRISIGFLPQCVCDAQLMQQVWTCLLSNAIKFSAGKPAPAIEVGSSQAEGRVIYFVKDNGVGFDMDYAHKLFRPFERLHHDSEFAGTGIGLALVQRIIERHGGKVWAEAKENTGAAFYFSIPVHQAESKNTANTVKSSAS